MRQPKQRTKFSPVVCPFSVRVVSHSCIHQLRVSRQQGICERNGLQRHSSDFACSSSPCML